MSSTIVPGKARLALSGGEIETLYLLPGQKDKQAGTTIVLLHEGLGSVAMWKDFPARVVAQTNCPVLAYSRFGYGESDPCSLPRPLSYMEDEAATTLAELIPLIDADGIVLVGHSDGASIAAIYAGGDADPRLRGIILMAPHFFIEEISIASIRQADIAYRQGELRQRLKRYHGDNVDTAFRGWNDAWLNPRFHQWDITGYLPNITVPGLLIQGVDDEYGTEKQLQAMQQLTNGPLTTLLLEQCRHSPHRDQGEKTLSAITDFISGLDSEPAP